MDIRVGAYGVIYRDGRLLLTHWNQYGRTAWTLPGGGMEPGETPSEAAVREIYEETGYRARLDGVLDADGVVIAPEDRLLPGDGPMHSVRIIYRAEIEGGELVVETDGSTDDARWFTLEELRALPRVALVDRVLDLIESGRLEDRP